ncbi:MAG: YihY/virulence factor BrkB family protein [Bacteroidota bacterium]
MISFKSFLEIILKSKPILWGIKLLKRIILPGFEGLPLWDVLVFFVKGITKGAITQRAAASSFNFFLALFPTFIFFFTIIPYMPIAHFQDALMGLIKEVIPSNTFDSVQSTLEDIIKRQHGGLLSVGFLMSLYFSTNGINSLIESFNRTYHVIETRSVVKQRLISIFLVVMLTFMLIIAISLIVFSSHFLKYLVIKGLLKRNFVFYIIIFLKWIVVIALMVLGISLIYYYAPVKKKEFRFFTAGSLLATGLSIITMLGFNIYITNFSKYNAIYGSIGTLIIIMLWIYFNAIILLVGFDLNASIHNASKHKKSLNVP